MWRSIAAQTEPFLTLCSWPSVYKMSSFESKHIATDFTTSYTYKRWKYFIHNSWTHLLWCTVLTTTVFLKLLVSWEPFGNKHYRWTYTNKGKVQGFLGKNENQLIWMGFKHRLTNKIYTCTTDILKQKCTLWYIIFCFTSNR
jgi:hypothetical protein